MKIQGRHRLNTSSRNIEPERDRDQKPIRAHVRRATKFVASSCVLILGLALADASQCSANAQAQGGVQKEFASLNDPAQPFPAPTVTGATTAATTAPAATSTASPAPTATAASAATGSSG